MINFSDNCKRHAGKDLDMKKYKLPACYVLNVDQKLKKLDHSDFDLSGCEQLFIVHVSPFMFAHLIMALKVV